ncbi:hypothetical protein TVAG_308170 [Trichomonas vaginalis G3]|uniref:Uncharacterized protein n=1 Tax=Trichomonas vaginalis (strain ATCC PRA-98 / G3) TaxID=412133 RepID=A2EGL6_TRIV3|nr:hypothetical protein TVAGG3_0539760 [Trichomonas vaginalis G3]EAY08211.1 hypothetical protein TVAG_308170 [Trichomonas vaginalis G3]KAI5519746.1 hypothetical protein TVAGG3_0539760 [Trichomonas vaginalis G3]|eukprot:XP_001320434.1 hypothetical protein [Trichomonas vaginalis G3]
MSRPNFSEMIASINAEEKRLTDENTQLKKILQIQDTLIEKQRKLLQEVSQTSNELLEVENKRKEIKEKLSSQKTELLVTSSSAQQVSTIIQNTLASGQGSPEISETQSGKFALKLIEAISRSIYQITEDCIKSETLSVSADRIHAAINDADTVIQKIIDAGLATESQEDTIRRNSYTIYSLVQPQE